MPLFWLQSVMREATEAVFTACGMDEKGAATCADVLLSNDLRGNDSHGVSNMLRKYVGWFRNGDQNPNPEFKIKRETPGTAVIDADGALGLHAAPYGMKLAVEKARLNGVGAVTVLNAGHLGGAGFHAMVAAKNGCIGQVFAAPGGSIVCPTFGAEPRFGTHPIAWAAPSGKEAPFLFDVATSQVAGNKLRLAARLGVKLAPNWVTTMEGQVVETGSPKPKP